MGFGFGKRTDALGTSTIHLVKGQRSRANDNFTTDLTVRRAIAVFECCASYGTYVDVNDVYTGWRYLLGERVVSTDLEAPWKELDRILLTYSNAGTLAKSDKDRARHLMDTIEEHLGSAQGKVEGMADAVAAFNIARLNYPSKNWIFEGVLAAACGVLIGALLGTAIGGLAGHSLAMTNVVFYLVTVGSVLAARYRHQKRIAAADAKIAHARAELDRMVLRNLSPCAYPPPMMNTDAS